MMPRQAAQAWLVATKVLLQRTWQKLLFWLVCFLLPIAVYMVLNAILDHTYPPLAMEINGKAVWVVDEAGEPLLSVLATSTRYTQCTGGFIKVRLIYEGEDRPVPVYAPAVYGVRPENLGSTIFIQVRDTPAVNDFGRVMRIDEPKGLLGVQWEQWSGEGECGSGSPRRTQQPIGFVRVPPFKETHK